MRALTLRPDGAAAVAELADGDAALADVCRLLGCRRVEAVTFAADLVMWLDEDTRPAGTPTVNRAATLLGARFERGRVYGGSVVYTGGADPHGTPRGLVRGTGGLAARAAEHAGGRDRPRGAAGVYLPGRRTWHPVRVAHPGPRLPDSRRPRPDGPAAARRPGRP